MSAIRKKRLTEDDRHLLYNHARSLVMAPNDTEELAEKAKSKLEVAQNVAQQEVIRLANKQTPAADLKVLEKYDAVSEVCELHIIARVESKDGTGKHVGFEDTHDSFTLQDDARVTLPNNKVDRYGEKGTPIILDKKALEALNNWTTIKEETALVLHEREHIVAELLGDYRALIGGAKTFEDLVEVWPEALGVKEQIVPIGMGLSALSADAMARINADIASRLLLDGGQNA